MLPRYLPKQHRHDGTSPLPLGMDWSPAPKKWAGKDTIWPHDPRTGWSYCVTIPSWIFLPEPASSDNSMTNPVVFYRVQVGIQSPEGITTARVLSKRFSDFLRLFSELKKAFPKKTMPQPPPKHALLRINSSRLLLEERRYALEAWMGKLLSDIEYSRSIHVASFLELEAAARSSFQEVTENCVEKNVDENMLFKSLLRVQTGSGASVADSTSVAASASRSIASDCGSDSAYETSDPELSRQEVDSNDLRGTKMGPHCYPVKDDLQSLSVTEEYPSVDSITYLPSKSDKLLLKKNILSGDSSNEELLSSGMGFTPERVDKSTHHVRKLSADSIGSDVSSLRGSEISNHGISNLLSDTFGDLSEREVPGPVDAFGIKDAELLNEQVILTQDQKSRLNRIFFTIQRRLTSAKTDMEDVIARLNQEIAVKEYLRTKVKDLEVELESTRQRNKEQMEQAIMGERERVTQIQWDMDELNRKYIDLQTKFKCQQDEEIQMELEKNSAIIEKEKLTEELGEKRKELDKLLKRMENLELKSKSDVKVLSKEVKSLRISQSKLREKLNESLKEKTELEGILHKKMQRWEQKRSAEKKLLHECRVLQQRLQECHQNFPSENELNAGSFSVSDMLDSLVASDNRIGLLHAEAQLIAQEDASTFTDFEYSKADQLPRTIHNGEDFDIADDELRETLTGIIVDNAGLRKEINSIIRTAIQLSHESEKEGEFSQVRTILSKLLER